MAETARPDAPGHPSWLLFGALLVLLGACLVAQFHPFVLPNNDYKSFEAVARDLVSGELPAGFKRMPVFPAIFGGLSLALPGRHAMLNAALLVNLAFSLATLVLVFVLARRCFEGGRGALLAPLLLATSVQFHLMGLQPLVEPSLTFFVVLSIVLLERGSPWQYAAAFCVALSRYEAGLIVPVLFAANVLFERRVLRHLVLAAAACSGVVLWTVASRLLGEGAGGSFYLELMEGMGWQPSWGFVERAIKEPFRGWYVRSRLMIVPFALAVGVPGLLGTIALWRRVPRTTLALVAYWVLGVGIVVAFGINKARYVTHTQWIPLFFWAAGISVLMRIVAQRLSRAPAWAGWALAAGFAAIVTRTAARLAWAIADEPGAVAPAADLALLWGVMALCAGMLLWMPGPGTRAARAAAAMGVLALATPLLGGGLVAKTKGLYKVYWANQSAAVLAPWLAEHLGDDRAVVLAGTHIDHLVGIGSPQLIPFAAFEVEGADAFAEAMRAQGVRYAIYTYRREPDDPSEAFYWKLHHMHLAELFKTGEPVPGFEHVATLPLPEHLGRLPVQIYRLASWTPSPTASRPRTTSRVHTIARLPGRSGAPPPGEVLIWPTATSGGRGSLPIR